MAKLTIKDLKLKEKKVLMRVDFNVPQDENLNITDDTRIKASLPSIREILKNGASKVILISHLGRPKGRRVDKFSLRPVAVRLQQLLNQPVKLLDDCLGDAIKKEAGEADEKIILLENLRFHPQEEANDDDFAKQLSGLADFFVNDAFGTAHRAHASTEGVTKYLKSASGLLLEKEIQYLGKALENPERPFITILGGAKVSDKIAVINNLLPKCDSILIGGGMAYTFLLAQGTQIGQSKLESDKLDQARQILEKAKNLKKDIILPIDHVIVDKIQAGSASEVVVGAIPENKIAVDIGPKTVDLFKQRLEAAKTVLWNGPLGIFEMEPFDKGTEEIAKYLANLSAVSIIGGGDTAAAVSKFHLEGQMTHISTGGGASLEFMEGKTLPGIAALTEK